MIILLLYYYSLISAHHLSEELTPREAILMTKDLCRITGPYGKQHLTKIEESILKNQNSQALPCLTGLTWLFCICLYFLFPSSQSCHPSATSRIIIREKPRAKERTPMFE